MFLFTSPKYGHRVMSDFLELYISVMEIRIGVYVHFVTKKTVEVFQQGHVVGVIRFGSWTPTSS